MLSEYLSPETICLQYPAKNWREAVQASGALLEKTGRCEPRYVEAMIQVVKIKGPYMVIAPGLALAHARPEDGALAVGMGILSLSTPIYFGSEANDPVELVISFCSTDYHSHTDMLQNLAVFLINDDYQKMLKTSSSIAEIIAAFKQYDQETIQCQN